MFTKIINYDIFYFLKDIYKIIINLVFKIITIFIENYKIKKGKGEKFQEPTPTTPQKTSDLDYNTVYKTLYNEIENEESELLEEEEEEKFVSNPANLKEDFLPFNIDDKYDNSIYKLEEEIKDNTEIPNPLNFIKINENFIKKNTEYQKPNTEWENLSHINRPWFSDNNVDILLKKMNTKTVTTEPVTTEPVTTEPVTTEPVTTKLKYNGQCYFWRNRRNLSTPEGIEEARRRCKILITHNNKSCKTDDTCLGYNIESTAHKNSFVCVRYYNKCTRYNNDAETLQMKRLPFHKLPNLAFNPSQIFIKNNNNKFEPINFIEFCNKSGKDTDDQTC